MKILVLGGAGMLGHKIFETLVARDCDVSCTIHGSKSDVNIKDFGLFQSQRVIEGVNAMEFSNLSARLREIRPDVIINCIGVIKQRDLAKAAIPSIKINSLLPHELAAWSQSWGGRIIHFSTDCVFTGDRGNYSEGDLSDATDLYGKTKLLGEVQDENALTIRTSIIGRELSHFQSLLEWFLRQRNRSVSGYTKAIYSGVTTNHLAEVVAWLIEAHPSLNGLYQVVSSPISKYDLLTKLKYAFDVATEVVPVDGEICDRSMSGAKFNAATGYICPSWDELVSQMASDATNYAPSSQTAQHALI